MRPLRLTRVLKNIRPLLRPDFCPTNIKPPKRQRLDVLLVDQGLAPTRTKAQALILAGRIHVDDQPVSKVGTLVSPQQILKLIDGPRFVSRGGEKLEGALQDFKLSVNDLTCIDIGASTGGFTDCLLQHGAQKVYAIDVGTHQLIDSLRADSRVVSMENTHILQLNPAVLDPKPSFAVVDVSFISSKKVIPKCIEFMPAGSPVLIMVKPQFEVGPHHLKKGVVRDEQVQHQAVKDVIEFAKSLHFDYLEQTPSRLKGPKGNQEYFIHLKTPSL